jgi:exopolyphosphatase/pppGpp-phosphohydrolase
MRPPGIPLPSAIPILLALYTLAGWSVPALAQSQTSMHGGIEIGAKGVKATVLQVTLDKQGLPTKVGKPRLNKTANTTLAVVEKDQMANRVKFKEAAIKETAEEVGKFFKLMQKDFRVPPENIYVIASSGLPDATNKQALVKAVEEVTGDGAARGGKKLMFIDQSDEVRLSIMGLLRDEDLGSSVFVDVGSGSTKCGYIEQETRTSVQRMSIVKTRLEGTVSFTRRITGAMKDSSKDFVSVSDSLRDDRFTSPLRDELDRRPGLANRNSVFLSGGIVWALVTVIKPETVNDPLVRITVADIEKFHQRLAKNPNVFPEPDLAGIADAKTREAAAKDVQRVRDTFTTENLLAGAEILRGVARAFRLEQSQKTIYFTRDGYIAWIYAYVKESALQTPR